MTTIKKTIGRLPVFKGEYVSGKGYARMNRVTLYGSEFQSLIDNNTYPPATLNAEGTQITFDTVHWKVVSNGTDAYMLHNRVNQKMAEMDTVIAAQNALMEEVEEKLDTLNGNDVEVVSALPAVADAEAKKIYRLQGEASYTDYMLNKSGTELVAIATYAFPGIDEDPTPRSGNLVKSGGVFDSVWPKVFAYGQGYINNKTGVIVETTAWRYSEMYIVYEGLSIDVYSRINDGEIIVAYYDAGGNYLKDISPIDEEAVSSEYKLRSIVVPAGVTYVRYHSAYDKGTDSYIILHTNSNVLTKSILDFINFNTDGVIVKASINGFVNQNTGQVVNNIYWRHSSIFPVSPGSVFTLYSRVSNSQILIAFYGKDGNFLKSLSPTSSEETAIYKTNDVTVPNSAAYAIFHSAYDKGITAWCKLKSGSILENACQTKEIYDYKTILKSSIELAGKKMVFFGDSITYGIASCEPSEAHPYGLLKCDNPYAKLLCENLGVYYSEQNNKGISGSRFAGTHEGTPSITSTLLAYSGTADIIYIAGGTNDYATSSEIGSVTDDTQDTLYGALNLICEYLKANYSDAIVFFALPINMSKGQANSVPLDKYREVIYEVAVSNGYYVIDCSQIGFPQEITANGTPDFKEKTIYDGIHPTELGHKIMADVISHIINAPAVNDKNIVGPILDESFNQSTVNTENIWCIELPYLSGKVKKITFIAKEGTVYFYKVSAASTAKGSQVSYTLIDSVVNTESEDNTIKSIDVSTKFGLDEYIGINGAFSYKTSGITRDEFKTFAFTVSNNKITSADGMMAVGMNVTVEPEHDEEIPDNVVIVDGKGQGDYVNLYDAMVALQGRDTANSPITIMVMPGTYEMPTLAKEDFFKYCNNRYLSIVGTDKVNCILRNDNGYYNASTSQDGNLGDNSVLKISGNIYIANLTIISTDEENADETSEVYHSSYCIHIDADAAEGSIMEVHNCRLVNNHAPCIGFGIPKNVTLKITDCELEADFYAPNIRYGGAILYGHDRGGSTEIAEEHLFVKGCTFISPNGHAVKTINNQNALMDCVFVNNACDLPNGKGVVLADHTTVIPPSFGNSIEAMNA